uniref:SEM7A n=1 Tax=Heligmosomoides polygyrus TaxID=6339 RepID=A0A8L8KLJ7_HELPZ
LCHAHGHFGLCLCRTGEQPCNKRYSNDTELEWVDSDIIIMNSVSHKVTGFTADYARNRVLQMRVEGYPETFPGLPLNCSRLSVALLSCILSVIISSLF